MTEIRTHTFTAEPCSFLDVLSIWTDQLWLGRKSKIEPTSQVCFMGGYKSSIRSVGNPLFWQILVDGRAVAVNSGLSTDTQSFRSRGLWVDPNFRQRGFSQILLGLAQEAALNRGHRLFWSMPRQSAIAAYLKFGFVQCSDFFTENVEFGPNCFVKKDLSAL